jgi:hypothetical protein
VETGYPVPGIRPTSIASLRGPRVSIDEQHVALPKLYGAPAYARPAAPVSTAPRPFDPDELPIEAFRTDEEHELVSTLPARAWAPGGAVVEGSRNGHTDHDADEHRLQPRALRLRGIAGKLLGGS